MTQPTLLPAEKSWIKFTVYGLPAPQGSSRAFIPKGWTRAVITTDNTKLKPWRQEIASTAKAAMDDAFLLPLKRDVAVQVNIVFYFPRPKSLKKAVTQKTTKPDLDKLIRAAWDAMTGIVFEDDAQVCRGWMEKAFDGVPRVEIEVIKL